VTRSPFVCGTRPAKAMPLLHPDRFVESRRARWRELETLLARSRRALQEMPAHELDQLGRLYRAATADLALAQREFPEDRVTAYLNQLVGKAHAVIYRSAPLRRRALLDFYRHGFPA